MKRLAQLACALVSVVGLSSPSFADEKSDAVLGELATQLKEMRGELNALRQENQRLQAMVAHQQQPAPRPVDPRVMMPGGSETPTQLFEDESQIRIYTRPGASPPSWLDMLIEHNRMRTMEALARARANERLADERLAKIAAESRAIGTNYCPRPLRETALAGGDVKGFRDQFVAARSADFDALFNQVAVKEYLQSRADRLQATDRGSDGNHGGNGRIAPSNVRILASKMRRNMEDATILFGTRGLNGPAPAGLTLAEEMTRNLRDSSNPLVSGPARDAIAMGHRTAAVEEAVAEDMDLELVLRMKAVREANRRMMGGYSPSAAEIAEDLSHFNNVLNGKISRTRVPEVQAFQGVEPPRN